MLEIVKTDNKKDYTRGDRVYNKRISQWVTIDTVTISSSKHIRYIYNTEKGASGAATIDDLTNSEPTESSLKEGDRVAINSCALEDLNDAFPNLPGGKGRLARKMISERPYLNHQDFIDRMSIISDKVDWSTVAEQLDIDPPEPSIVA